MSTQNGNFDLETAVRTTTENAIQAYLQRRRRNKNYSEHVILDRIFPRERHIRSIIGGLETSLGTTLWEPLAKAVAIAGGYEILKPENFKMPVELLPELQAVISKWQRLREKPNYPFEFNHYLDDIKGIIKKFEQKDITYGSVTSGDGIDLWIRKDGKEFATDIKTVQINQNAGKSFAEKIMKWYAYRLMHDSSVDFKAFIAFPYSPYDDRSIDSWWQRNGGRAYPLIRGIDALVQEEFWNLLGDSPNTWQRILTTFEKMGESDWSNQYHELFYGNENT